MEKIGKCLDCPKCGGEDFNVEYASQYIVKSVYPSKDVIDAVDDRLLNTCTQCRYMEYSYPLDYKESKND